MFSEWDKNSSKQKSNAIILHGTLPPICIEKEASRKNDEVLYTETSKSPRPAPTITLKANLRKDWNSDVAASSSSSQPTKQNHLAGTGPPVILKSRATLDQQNRDEAANEDEEIDQGSTGKPVIANSGILDFLNSGFATLKSGTSRRKDEFVIGSIRSKAILTKMIYKLI